MRNIINPDQLANAIAARSTRRAASVQQWLGNQFRRWCLSHFDKLQTVHNASDYQRLIGEAAPFWFTNKLEQGENFDYLDPNHPELRELEGKLAEYLTRLVGSNEERKFPRYTVEQVLTKWTADHERMQRRRAFGWCETDGTGIRSVFATNKMYFVEFVGSGRSLRAELSNESHFMRHCVGQFDEKTTLSGGYGEEYVQAIEDGRMRIFSMRDEQGQPHATLSFDLTENSATGQPQLSVEQIKGKQNRPPIEKYVSDLIAFLNHLKIQQLEHADCHSMGVFFHRRRVQHIRNIDDPQKLFQAVSLNPKLIYQLNEITPALRWAALRRQPNLINELPNCSPAQLYSAGQWLNGQLPETTQSTEPEWLRPALAKERLIQIDGKTLALEPQPPKPKNLFARSMDAFGWFIDKLPAPAVPLMGLLTMALILILAIPVIVGVFVYVIVSVTKNKVIDGMEDRSEWAMAMAGIFIFRFDDTYRKFDTHADDEKKANRAAMFARDWGIGGEGVSQEQSRQQVLEQIKSMWRDGHFSSYIYRPESKYSAKDVLAFDLTRMGLLIRTGVLLEYITEEEGWNYMYCGAAQVQDIFDSWDDYGEGYIRGRAWWAGENCTNVQEQYKKFRADETTTWAKLEWRDYDVFVTDEDHHKARREKAA